MGNDGKDADVMEDWAGRWSPRFFGDIFFLLEGLDEEAPAVVDMAWTGFVASLLPVLMELPLETGWTVDATIAPGFVSAAIALKGLCC